jgi:UDPglucose--hexose-1-phosphate uridylyltransferase
MPVRHGAHLHTAPDKDLASVGRGLRNALASLRSTLGDVAYNLVFHTAPHHHAGGPFHWHLHVLPRITNAAGFEQGTGVLINVVAPEDAAAELRSAAPRSTTA